MLRMKKLVVLAFSLLFLASGLLAQPRAYKRDCIVCSVDFNAGWYKPGLDYLNDESYINDVQGEFNGGLVGSALVNFKLIPSLYASAGAGFWNDRVNVKDYPFPGGIVLDELLGITMVPVILQMKYEFSAGGGGYPGSLRRSTSKIHPFVGGGTSLNYIRQRYKRVQDGAVTDKGTLNGISQTYHVLAGLKVAVNSFVDVGLEYNHTFGGFDQAFLDEGSETIENINLGGPLIVGKLTMYLYERRGFYNNKALKRFKGKYKTPRRR